MIGLIVVAVVVVVVCGHPHDNPAWLAGGVTTFD